nr:Tar ligand binding domain-containing protein [Pseudomonas sp.]
MIEGFRSLRVGTALTAMLLAFVLIFAGSGLGGMRLLHSANEWVNELGRDNVVRAHAVNDATIALLRAQTLITDARMQMESGLETERDASLAAAREQLARAESRFADFSTAMTSGGGNDQAVLIAYRAWMDDGLEPWWQAVQGWNGLVAQQLERDRIVP